MKNFALVLFFAVAMAFSENPADWKYHLSFCTTVQDIDYCMDHEIILKFLFSDSLIIASNYGDSVFVLEVKSPWRYNDATGERFLKVWSFDNSWTLTEKEKSFVLDDHRCSTIEFWHGSRKSQHKAHRYVLLDEEDLFKFTEVCEKQMSRRPKKLKKKKFDSNRLIMGALPGEIFYRYN